MDCKVGFIGFGLIAGSIAHALKESGNNYNIAATSRRLEPVYEAKKTGLWMMYLTALITDWLIVIL